VEGQLTSVNFREGQPVEAGTILAMIDEDRLQRELVVIEEQLERNKQRLANLQTPAERQAAANRIEEDEQRMQSIALERAASKITAPISGIAGFRLIEPGNIVHPGEAIVVIAQVQPISVVFTVPQDYVPGIQQRLKSGGAPSVEAWKRDGTERLATGKLIALDNQIDEKTGTVKLKASFENKDNALFPNQFVNVRMPMHVTQ
jgi:multidrug efflux system membrane fusion protein